MYAHPKAATVLAVKARLKRMALRDDVPTKGFPYELPAVKHLGKVQFHERVTFIVGDNGMGKSTLVEALAIVAGFPPEGGSRTGVRRDRCHRVGTLQVHPIDARAADRRGTFIG